MQRQTSSSPLLLAAETGGHTLATSIHTLSFIRPYSVLHTIEDPWWTSEPPKPPWQGVYGSLPTLLSSPSLTCLRFSYGDQRPRRSEARVEGKGWIGQTNSPRMGLVK